MALVTLNSGDTGSVTLTGETVFTVMQGMVALGTDGTGKAGALPVEAGVSITIGGTLTVTWYWLEGSPAKLQYMPVA